MRTAWYLPVGIMVEVPAAAETVDLLAPEVDFFSIGSNDLAQYLFAADRGQCAGSSPGRPAASRPLRQLGRVIETAHASGRRVGLCGELAGQVEGIPLLLGLGLDEFSMSPEAIPAARRLIGELAIPEAAALVRTALNLPDGQAVRAQVRRFLDAL